MLPYLVGNKPKWHYTCPILEKSKKVNSGVEFVGPMPKYVTDYHNKTDYDIAWEKSSQEAEEACDDFKRAVAKMPISVGIYATDRYNVYNKI